MLWIMQKCNEIFLCLVTPPSIQVLETQKTDIFKQGLREIWEGIEANNDDEVFLHNGKREENEESLTCLPSLGVSIPPFFS